MEPGQYEININGIISSFTIQEVIAPPTTVLPQTMAPSPNYKEINIWIIVGIVVGILIIFGLVLLILKTKKHRE
jgi:nitrate reductase gamma subunit